MPALAHRPASSSGPSRLARVAASTAVSAASTAVQAAAFTTATGEIGGEHRRNRVRLVEIEGRAADAVDARAAQAHQRGGKLTPAARDEDGAAGRKRRHQYWNHPCAAEKCGAWASFSDSKASSALIGHSMPISGQFQITARSLALSHTSVHL